MPKIIKEAIDNLNAVVTLTLEKADYESQFEQELQKFRKQAAIKGFRKGKTPAGMVRKMYGKSVLVEIVNKKLSETLYGYIAEEKLEVLGQPLPSKDQPYLDFDATDLQDFVFKFDLGLSPQFEVQGLNADAVFERYEIAVTEAEVQEELDGYRQRLGTRTEVTEGTIQQSDFVKFAARAVEGDFTADFGIMVSEIEDQAFKDELFTKQAGDTLRANIYQWFEEPDEHYIRHHLLKIDHDDHETMVEQEFDLTVLEVTRSQAAELNDEFFKKAFGDNATNEEEAKALIRQDIAELYDQQIEALLFRDLQEHLLRQNPLPLPDAFLTRWLQTSNEKVSAELIERDYPAFAKNLQWTLLRNKLAQQFDIQITEEAILEGFKNQARRFLGGYGDDELLTTFAERQMDDEKQYNDMYQNLLTDRLQKEIAQVVTVQPKQKSREEFIKIVEEARAAARTARVEHISVEGEEETERPGDEETW